MLRVLIRQALRHPRDPRVVFDAKMMSTCAFLHFQQREGVRPLLDQRDEMVTLLARGDPAAADRLSDLYSAYREVMR